MLSLWHQLLFSYGSEKTARKFLMDRYNNIITISCCVHWKYSGVLYVEGRLRDTSSFIWNCSQVDEHHSEWQERQTTPLTMQPQQRQWVNAKWKSDIFPWTYAQYLINLSWHHTLLRNNRRSIGLTQPYYNLSLTPYIWYEKAAHMSSSNNLLWMYHLCCSF